MPKYNKLTKMLYHEIFMYKIATDPSSTVKLLIFFQTYDKISKKIDISYLYLQYTEGIKEGNL